MAGFSKEYPSSVTEVEAHGLFVGLPEGLMGNSEVGHLNIGAGRVVYQVQWGAALTTETRLAEAARISGYRQNRPFDQGKETWKDQDHR